MQQTILRPNPNIGPDNANTRTQTIIITAISLFALSGLLIGFLVGAVTRTSQAAQPTQHTKPTPLLNHKTSPTAPPVQKVRLGCPIVDQYIPSGVADGTISYTFQAHAVDHSGKCPISGNPVQQPGITCKLWLSKIPDHDGGRIVIPNTVWGNIDTIQQPIDGEISNGLIFDPTTPQTQMCNNKGQGTWKFGISPDVKHGSYYLVVLTDWSGTVANWTWVPFEVKKGQ